MFVCAIQNVNDVCVCVTKRECACDLRERGNGKEREREVCACFVCKFVCEYEKARVFACKFMCVSFYVCENCTISLPFLPAQCQTVA